MQSGDVSDLPNPFAPDPVADSHPTDAGSQHRHALVSSLKLLGLLLVGFVVFTVVTQRGPDWLAMRLTSGFQSLDTPTKQARLIQLSDLGDPGIHGLVVGLADSDPAVADQSRQLIRDIQTSWISMPEAAANRSRRLLTQALQAADPSLPLDRQAWVRELIQNAQRGVPTPRTSESDQALEPAVAQASYQNTESLHESTGIYSADSLPAVPRPRARVIQVRIDESGSSDVNRVRQPMNDLRHFSRDQPMLLRAVRDL